jgi:hypothetical protein
VAIIGGGQSGCAFAFALRRAGIHTIGDILRLGRAHFATPGRRIGPVARMEIAHGLEQSGFHWTAEGRLPMPGLPSVAALMVGGLGQGAKGGSESAA